MIGKKIRKWKNGEIDEFKHLTYELIDNQSLVIDTDHNAAIYDKVLDRVFVFKDNVTDTELIEEAKRELGNKYTVNDIRTLLYNWGYNVLINLIRVEGNKVYYSHGLIDTMSMANGTILSQPIISSIPTHCIGTVYLDGGFEYQLQPINLNIEELVLANADRIEEMSDKSYLEILDFLVQELIDKMAEDLGIPEHGYIDGTGRWYERI